MGKNSNLIKLQLLKKQKFQRIKEEKNPYIKSWKFCKKIIYEFEI